MKQKFPLIAALVVIIIAVVLVISNQSQPDDTNQNGNTATTSTASGSQDAGSRSGTTTSNRRLSSQLSTMEWQEKIDLLLADDNISIEQASQKLLAITLDQQAPLTTRNDALEHALNLIKDEQFKAIYDIMGTGKHELPAPLVQTILDDTLNRANPIQLKTALLVLQGTHSEIREEAIELLEFHTDEEYGDDLMRWNNAVIKYINELEAKSK